MRALVTGASGLVGSRLTQMLVSRGAEVTVLAGAEAHPQLEGLRVGVVRGGLTDLRELRMAVRDQTHIFHCGACLEAGAREQRLFEINMLGTGMLLDVARGERRLRRLVHLSTTEVYGHPERPGDETAELVTTGTAYVRSRVEAESAVWAYADGGLPVTVLRPGTVFGPSGDANYGAQELGVEVATRLRQGRLLLVDGGRAAGGFCYVDSVACAALTACEREETRGQAYNLADGTGASWREYVSALAAEMGVREPWIDLPWGVAMGLAAVAEFLPSGSGLPSLTRRGVRLMGCDREFSAEKAQRDFGFRPAVSFSEAIRRTVAGVRGPERVPVRSAVES